MDATDFIWMGTKIFFLVAILLQVVPIMVWVERRGSALMQNRLGPNRVGPLGLLQSLADVVKFMWKEDPIPGHVFGGYYLLAPLISLVPAFMTFAVIPFAAPIVLEGRVFTFQVADLNVGLIYVLSLASLGVYGIIMAGWASRNKYAMLGSLRSSSQMISYELAMGFAIVGIVMLFSSVKLGEIAAQQGTLFAWGLPRWGIFLQPLGFLIFFVTIFAETNRLPFDLPEGESELVAGYHLEYGSMKFAMFMMAEYLNMLTASGMLVTLYLGGFQLFPGLPSLLSWIQQWYPSEILRVLFEMGSFGVKVAFVMWVFVWVRWTLPRFRYDQLMELGWKVLLPLSLVNVLVTAFFINCGWI